MSYPYIGFKKNHFLMFLVNFQQVERISLLVGQMKKKSDQMGDRRYGLIIH